MIKVSVIIPVYNSEATIIRCLESVMSQSFKDFNVVVINDGSSDHSLEIINDYVLKNNHQSIITVISQFNSGVSHARNSGLIHATGEYVVFVDSDDRVTDSHLQSLISASQEVCQPTLICNTLHDHHQRVKKLELSGNFNDELFVNAYVGLERCNQLGYLHNKIFCKKIVDTNHLLFPEGIHMAEDHIFILQYLKYIKAIYISKEITYEYAKTENSLSERKLNKSEIMMYLPILESAYSKLAESKESLPKMVKWINSFYKVKKITALMSVYIYLVVKGESGSKDLKKEINGCLCVSELQLLKKINLIKYFILTLPNHIAATVFKKLYGRKY